MSRFEYLSVLISIVIALGLSEVLVCWARLIRHRSSIRFYWVHALWSALVLLLIVQFWWGFWQFQVVERWTFSGLVLVVLQSITLVLAALLLTPSREEPPPSSLRDYYYENARPVFVLATVLMGLFVTVDTLVGQQPLLHPENVIRPVAALLLTGLAITRAPVWHAAGGVIALGLFLAFTVVAYVNEGL